MADLQTVYGSSDPYMNFKFRVQWDNGYVPGISKISPLRRTTEVVEHREGGDPSTSRKSPGRSQYEAITLERGVTQDPAFYSWATQVSQPFGGTGADAQGFRKDILVELINNMGEVVLVFKVYRCWPSDYTAFADFSAESGGVAIERITLQNEGWERNVPAGAAVGQK